METKSIYQKIKDTLQHEGQSTKYFTKETLDTIIKDRLSYARSLAEGDSLEHAKYLAIAKVIRENTDIYGEITAEEE